jgi:hypothetical protein
MHQQDVEQLVEQVAVKLGRGLSLEDLDGVLLAYSSNQSHADRVRVNFLLSKRVPVDVKAWQLSHGIATAVRPVVVPANEELGMLGRVCVPLLVRGFRVGYLWVQQDIEDQSATAILTQLPGVRDELELLSGLLLESNTAESEFRRRREQEFLSACRGEANAVAAVAGWKEVQGRGPWQLVTVLDADGWSEGSDPIASTLIHRSAALQATIGVDAALFSAGTETHAVILFRESVGRAAHAQVLVHYQLELAKRSGRPVHRIILGTSEGFAKPRELADAYRESKQAARPPPWIPSWANWWTAGRRAYTSCWPPPEAAQVRGPTPDPCTGASWKITTGTVNCCPCWNSFTTMTGRSRTSPRSCTCTGAASTTGWAASGRCSGWIL